MSSIPVLQELEQLVSKYADVNTPIDILRAFAHQAKLEEANIVLHERMARDVYTIFGKSEEGEMSSETGKKLLSTSKVSSYHHANSVLVFHTEAEVEFNMQKDKQSSNKRKRDFKVSTAIDEPIIIKYQFSEQTLGAGSGTSPGSAKREKGVTVLEAPYKSINLIITMRRGHAGLEQSTVVDFQLLTSGCSPSSQRITLQELMGKEGGADAESEEGDCEGDEGSDEGSDEGCDGEEDACGASDDGEENVCGASDDGEVQSEGEGDEESGSEGGDKGDEDASEESDGAGDSDGDDGSESGIDTADYYNVNVCTDSLAKLKVWLGFKSLQEQQDEEEEEEARLAAEEAQRAKTSNGKKGAAAGKKQKQEQAPPTPEPSDDESEGGSGGEEEDEEDEEEGGAGEPSPYELDPALGDLLQFLLSLPYVDEAWGIHDLILDHELGANEEEEDEEGSDDGEEYCLPCCQ